MPKSESVLLVTKFRSVTNGRVAEEITVRGFETNFARASLCFMATRLGTSSPKIRVRNASTTVTNMVTRLSTVFPERVHHSCAEIQRAAGLANVTAAKAEARNPANVTPTCIVARNLPGSSINLRRIFAVWSPWSASRRTLASLSEMMAISEAAKKAFEAMARNRMNRCHPISVDSGAIVAVVFNVFYLEFWNRIAADL